MVQGRPKQAFKQWLAMHPRTQALFGAQALGERLGGVAGPLMAGVAALLRSGRRRWSCLWQGRHVVQPVSGAGDGRDGASRICSGRRDRPAVRAVRDRQVSHDAQGSRPGRTDFQVVGVVLGGGRLLHAWGLAVGRATGPCLLRLLTARGAQRARFSPADWVLDLGPRQVVFYEPARGSAAAQTRGRALTSVETFIAGWVLRSWWCLV